MATIPKRPRSQTETDVALVKNRLMGFELLKVGPATSLRLFLLFPCKIATDSNPRIKLSRRLPLLTKLPLRLPSPLQKLSLFLFSFSSFAKLLLLALSTMAAMLLNPFRVFMVVVERSLGLEVFWQSWISDWEPTANLMARAQTRYLVEELGAEKLPCSKTALLTQIWIALGCDAEVCNLNWEHFHAIQCLNELRLDTFQ